MKKRLASTFVFMLLITTSTIMVPGMINSKESYENFDANCPQDFELYIYCGGFNSWGQYYVLFTDASGKTNYYYFNITSEDFTLISTFDFTELEMNQIWNQIIEDDFFNLDSNYARETVFDGSMANMTVTGNGVTHSVQTENIDIDNFDNIVKTVNSLTPDDNDLFYSALYNNPPLRPEKPEGKINGSVSNEYEYTSVGYDVDDDDIYFMFDWGDGSNSSWTGPYKSGENITLKHSWTNKGSYNVRVKAIDDPNNDGDLSDGNETQWSDSLRVAMPKSRMTTDSILVFLLERIFKRYPFMELLLSYFQKNKDYTESPILNVNEGNNPYDSKSGTRGKIDTQKCAITIEIHITFYGEWVDKYWDQHGETFKKKVKKDIESKWNREQWDKNGDGKPDGEEPWRVQCKEGCDPREPGCTVNFEAHLGYKKNVTAGDLPVGGKAKKPENEGTHWVRPGYTNNDHSHVNAWGQNKDLPNANNGMETTGVFHINDFAGVYAHEAGHLMGLEDHQDEKEKTDSNGKKVKYKSPNKKNSDGSWNIMAWPSGWPSQEDINKIVKDAGIECPCSCCPKKNDTKKPENKITHPENKTNVPASSKIIVEGYANDGFDGSGVVLLDYMLEWDGGSHDGGEYVVDPPDNYVEYSLGPITPEDYVDPDDDWFKITTYATDAAGNTGEDSITLILVEEDTTPPITEKTIGEPQWEDGYTVASFTPIWFEATDPEPGSGVNHIHYEVWQGGILMGSEDVSSEMVEITFGMYGVTYGVAELRWYAVDNADNVESMHYQEHFILY